MGRDRQDWMPDTISPEIKQKGPVQANRKQTAKLPVLDHSGDSDRHYQRLYIVIAVWLEGIART